MSIYYPREDSFLLLKAVKKYAKGHVLDLGTGSGILAFEAARLKKVKSVVASDINRECLKKLRNIRAMHSDLFGNIKEKFDLIIFNPPYLPKDKREDQESALSTSGGKRGYEIIERFINAAMPWEYILKYCLSMEDRIMPVR